MAFELNSVVPWGRNLDEYIHMFSLTRQELGKRIIGFGDGPASFNYEMRQQGHKVISLDPVYNFSTEQLRQRIRESTAEVMEQTRRNRDNFVWKHIKDPEALEATRVKSMELFLEDFEAGKREGRYIPHALPAGTEFGDLEFEIGLSSHFLLLYSGLGYDFHIRSINEMLRICREIRLFPLVNLDVQRSEVLDALVEYYSTEYRVEIIQVDYEFQRGGNEMCRISRKTQL